MRTSFVCSSLTRRIPVHPYRIPLSHHNNQELSPLASLSRNLATSREPRSHLHPKGDQDEATTKSNRQKFREIPVNPSILRYVEMTGVGIPSRRKRSASARQRLWDELEEGRRSGRSGSASKPPPPFGSNEVGRHRIVVIGSVATTKDELPTNLERTPEVALAGRSNVGKSTLLNALLYGNRARGRGQGEDDHDDNRTDNPLIRKFRRGSTPEHLKLPKGIKASVSSKPGETRKITFYQLSHTPSITAEHDASCKLRLVDLPGYGFSFTPRDHDGFQDVLLKYLLERGKSLLQRVLLLLDARHGMKKADFEFLETLQDEAFKDPTKRKIPPIQVVLTKCDLVERDDLARRVIQVRQDLSDVLRRETGSLPVLLVSARAGVGFNNMRRRGAASNTNVRARGGVLELQKELAALVVPQQNKPAAPHNRQQRQRQQGKKKDHGRKQ